MTSNTESGLQKKHNTIVLFDVGSVLLDLSYDRFYEEAARLSKDKDVKAFRDSYTAANLEPRLHTNQISTQEYLDELERQINPSRKLSEEELRELVAKRYGGAINEVVQLKQRVYNVGYTIGIFSNTSAIDVEIFNQKYPEMLKVYNPDFPVILSFNVGSVKPQPEMYQKIKGFDRVILIDDKESYLRTGIEQFGWNGILFTPYIDRAEAIRAVHDDTTPPKKNFKVADSIDDLIKALEHFGVELK